MTLLNLGLFAISSLYEVTKLIRQRKFEYKKVSLKLQKKKLVEGTAYNDEREIQQ